MGKVKLKGVTQQNVENGLVKLHAAVFVTTFRKKQHKHDVHINMHSIGYRRNPVSFSI